MGKLKATQPAPTGEVKGRLEVMSFTVCSLSFSFRLTPKQHRKEK
jgi:hypothetical protein